jgi:hypothetical protein
MVQNRFVACDNKVEMKRRKLMEDNKKTITVISKSDLEVLIDILIRNGHEVNIKAEYDENDENMFVVTSYTVGF